MPSFQHEASHNICSFQRLPACSTSSKHMDGLIIVYNMWPREEDEPLPLLHFSNHLVDKGGMHLSFLARRLQLVILNLLYKTKNENYKTMGLHYQTWYQQYQKLLTLSMQLLVPNIPPTVPKVANIILAGYQVVPVPKAPKLASYTYKHKYQAPKTLMQFLTRYQAVTKAPKLPSYIKASKLPS